METDGSNLRVKADYLNLALVALAERCIAELVSGTMAVAAVLIVVVVQIVTRRPGDRVLVSPSIPPSEVPAAT
jgi:hypothetical protein